MHACLMCVYDVHKECIRSGVCLMCVPVVCVRCSQDACIPDVCAMSTRCMPESVRSTWETKLTRLAQAGLVRDLTKF